MVVVVVEHAGEVVQEVGGEVEVSGGEEEDVASENRAEEDWAEAHPCRKKIRMDIFKAAFWNTKSICRFPSPARRVLLTRYAPLLLQA